MLNNLIVALISILNFLTPQKILIIGDSEAGIMSHYINQVKTQQETVVFDYKVGSTIQYWMNGRFQKSIATNNPDIVIIFLGTNNLGRAEILDVSPILNATKDKKCIWVGPPAAMGHKWKFNKLLKDFVENNSSCNYFNSEDLVLDLPDGYHPTSSSAIYWLSQIWKFKTIVH